MFSESEFSVTLVHSCRKKSDLLNKMSDFSFNSDEETIQVIAHPASFHFAQFNIFSRSETFSSPMVVLEIGWAFLGLFRGDREGFLMQT